MCLTIEEGASTTLWCNATDGYPTPIVRWFIRDNNKIGNKGIKFKVIKNYDVLFCVLFEKTKCKCDKYGLCTR